MRKLFGLAGFVISILMLTVGAQAQAGRRSVSGAEVTGTFSRAFGGKFKGSASEIKIQALGKGKIKIAFDLTYPYIDGNGDLSANTGQIQGEAEIKGDTAVFSSSEYGPCRITIKFAAPGSIEVTQEEEGGGCGFGHKVTAEGLYKKTSNAKPKFGTE